MSETETVQVRMQKNTLEKVNKLQNLVHAPSRSDAIRRSVDISDVLINAIEEGDRIIIESKNGKQRQILIAGLNK